MMRRLLLPLHLLFVVASSLHAQDPQVSLCIVESKLRSQIQYDPPAGALAMNVYKYLAGRRLADGSPLKITVLPASEKKDILHWISRLQCSWVLELSRTTPDPLSYRSPFARYDDVYFSLWNGHTRKAIAKGSSLFPLPENRLHQAPTAASAFSEFADQILNRLNKSR